jgi:hypothetical protein
MNTSLGMRLCLALIGAQVSPRATKGPAEIHAFHVRLMSCWKMNLDSLHDLAEYH